MVIIIICATKFLDNNRLINVEILGIGKKIAKQRVANYAKNPAGGRSNSQSSQPTVSVGEKYALKAFVDAA